MTKPTSHNLALAAASIRAATVPYLKEIMEIQEESRKLNFFQKLMMAHSPSFDRRTDDLIDRMDAAIIGQLQGWLPRLNGELSSEAKK